MKRVSTILIALALFSQLSYGQLLQLSDLLPGSAAQIEDLTVWNESLYFRVLDYSCISSGSCEYNGLWKSDGTPAGTELVKSGNFQSLTPGMFYMILTAFGSDGTVNPNANNELWRSNGTPEGTIQIWNINVLPVSGLVPVISEISPSDANFYFKVLGNDTTLNGTWLSNGSLFIQNFTGTVGEIEKLGPGPAVFTTAAGIGLNSKLWVAQGGPDFTFELLDINASMLTEFGFGVYFAAVNSSAEYELWFTDGNPTLSGTFPVYNFGSSERITQIIPAENRMYIFTNDATEGSDQLYRYDGIGGSLTLLKSFVGTPIVKLDKVVGNDLYFTTFQGLASLWFSDGTLAGTNWVMDFNGLASYGAFEGGLAFCGVDAAMGAEPWISDGTGMGTMNITDVIPGPAGSFPDGFTELNESLYFSAKAPGSGERQLWKWTEETIVEPPASAIVAFNLINAELDIPFESYTGLISNTIVDWSTLFSYKLNVEAVIAEGVEVGSVVFTLNGEEFKTENVAPYALLGDSPLGDYKWWEPIPKAGEEYDICATPYSGADGSGEAGEPLCIKLTFQGDFDLTVKDFVLVDAVSDEDIMNLYEGAVLDLATLGYELNIRADIQPLRVGSVKFRINSLRRTDNTFPYSLAGDVSGDYTSWTPEPGNYYLRAKAFSRPSGKGFGGDPFSIHFSVINSAEIKVAQEAVKSLHIYPVPASDHVVLQPIFEEESNGNAQYRVFDMAGRLITQGVLPVYSGSAMIELDLSGWQSGLYSAIIELNGKYQTGKFSVIK